MLPNAELVQKPNCRTTFGVNQPNHIILNLRVNITQPAPAPAPECYQRQNIGKDHMRTYHS